MKYFYRQESSETEDDPIHHFLDSIDASDLLSDIKPLSNFLIDESDPVWKCNLKPSLFLFVCL